MSTLDVFESCAGIEAGPAFAVESPGDVTMTAGTRVVLKDGFSVGSLRTYRPASAAQPVR